jgi:hypothetical protein
MKLIKKTLLTNQLVVLLTLLYCFVGREEMKNMVTYLGAVYIL